MQRRMDTFTEGKPPQSQLGKALYEQFSMLSLAVMSTGDFYCAKIIALNAAPLATAYDDLAKKNARVKEVLEMIVSGGAWTGAVMATAAVAIPIAQHHGLYPEEWPNPFTLGIVPPSEEVTEHDATRPTPGPVAGWPDTPAPDESDPDSPGPPAAG